MFGTDRDVIVLHTSKETLGVLYYPSFIVIGFNTRGVTEGNSADWVGGGGVEYSISEPSV